MNWLPYIGANPTWTFDVFHALTDGTGMMELVRTLLYYYCSDHYGRKVFAQGIRLVGDSIAQEEWDDPAVILEQAPPP